MKTARRLMTLALSAALAFSCANEDNDAAEACEHMAEGPSVAVTAAVDPAASPSVSESHKRYDIALVELTSGWGGAVTYAAAEEGDVAIFLDRDLPLGVFDSSNTPVALEASDAVTACAEVKVKKTVPLKVGTYRISFGPSTEKQVRLVVEAAESHAGH